MIDLTPSKLREHIEESLKLRRAHTNKSRARIRSYATSNYREGWDCGDTDYYNHCFQWVTNIVPAHVLTNPAVWVQDMGHRDESTELLTAAMRSLIPMIRLSHQLRLIAYDQEFDFGVGHVQAEPTGGQWRPSARFVPMRPMIRRLSPRLYYRDHGAPEYGGIARYEGHIVVADIEDMQKARDAEGKPKYKDLETLVADEGVEELRQELLQDGIILETGRKQLVYFEHYDSERKQILCMAYDGAGARYIREPRPAGDESPYQLYGTYAVPDQVYPLANLAVSQKQAEGINRHRKQLADDVGSAKRLTIVNAQQQSVIDNLKNAPSGSVLSLPGFTGILATADIGGPMKETYDFLIFEAEAIDRLTGLTAFQRGEVTNATATEINEAGQFADSRIEFSKNIFTENVVATLNKTVRIIDESDDIAFPFVWQGQRATFYGGPTGDPVRQSGFPWKRSLTVQIEPRSMEYTNKDRLRNQIREAQAHILSVMGAAKMDPAVNAIPMIDDMMEALNMPGAGARYYDQRIAAAMQMMAMEQGQAGGEGPAMGDVAARAPKPSSGKPPSQQPGAMAGTRT